MLSPDSRGTCARRSDTRRVFGRKRFGAAITLKQIGFLTTGREGTLASINRNRKNSIGGLRKGKGDMPYFAVSISSTAFVPVLSIPSNNSLNSYNVTAIP